MFILCLCDFQHGETQKIKRREIGLLLWGSMEHRSAPATPGVVAGTGAVQWVIWAVFMQIVVLAGGYVCFTVRPGHPAGADWNLLANRRYSQR